MQCSILSVDDQRWISMIRKTPHDFYHLPEYVRVSAKQDGGHPAAFFAEEGGNEALIPLVIRPIEPGPDDQPTDLYDVTSPYGYGGPILHVTHGSPVEFWSRVLERFVAELKVRGFISAFLRLHPLQELPLAPLQSCGRLVKHGDTVSFDLSKPDEQIFVEMKRDNRRIIRKSWREGQIARVDESWSTFEDFLDIYYATMRKSNAQNYYFFPRNYFVELRDMLGSRVNLAVVEINRRVAASCLFVEECGFVQAHLMGTREAYVAEQPSRVLFDFVRRWAQERGNRYFHIGGGRGGRNDTLYRFKSGLSKTTHPFYSWRYIVDQREYERLVERRHPTSDDDANDVDGYFPAYRLPIIDI
jgi:hypothetical protein